MAIIKECIIWTNGMVMSFDEKGDQIPEYQGFILDTAEKLKIGCDENTKWILGDWGGWLLDAHLNWYWTKNKKNNVQDNTQDSEQDDNKDMQDNTRNIPFNIRNIPLLENNKKE